MVTLGEMAKILRSKNAGPFYLTVDFLFDDDAKYQIVKNSGILNEEIISQLYKVKKEDVKVYYYDKARGIKVTIPRKISSGSMYDTDVYGAQFHTPLMGLEMKGVDSL